MALFISQSGETADTLAALRHAAENGQKTAVVVNVASSSIAREADLVLPTHAGPEIALASPKPFTCHLGVLAAFAPTLARASGRLSAAVICRASSCVQLFPSLSFSFVALSS